MKTRRFPVVCLECGKKFSTTSMLPTCPKCKGGDIEPGGSYDESTNPSNGWRVPGSREEG